MADLIRYINITLAVACAVCGTPQWRRLMSGGREQLHWLASILLNATALIGSIEGLRLHSPPGIATYALAVALIFLLATVLYLPVQARFTRHEKEGQP
jgi:hypothetical protein